MDDSYNFKNMIWLKYIMGWIWRVLVHIELDVDCSKVVAVNGMYWASYFHCRNPNKIKQIINSCTLVLHLIKEAHSLTQSWHIATILPGLILVKLIDFFGLNNPSRAIA